MDHKASEACHRPKQRKKKKILKISYYSIISSIKKIPYFHLGLGNIHHLASQFIALSHSCGLWYTVVGIQAITPFNISVLQFFYQTLTQFYFKRMNGFLSITKFGKVFSAWFPLLSSKTMLSTIPTSWYLSRYQPGLRRGATSRVQAMGVHVENNPRCLK